MPGITDVRAMWLCPSGARGTLGGGGGTCLPSLVNSLTGLYVSTPAPAWARPWAGHQGRLDGEDRPRLCRVHLSHPTSEKGSISKHVKSEVTARKKKGTNTCRKRVHDLPLVWIKFTLKSKDRVFKRNTVVLLALEKEKFNVAMFPPVVVKYAVPAVRDVVGSGVEPSEEEDLLGEKTHAGQPQGGRSPCPQQRAASLCSGS